MLVGVAGTLAPVAARVKPSAPSRSTVFWAWPGVPVPLRTVTGTAVASTAGGVDAAALGDPAGVEGEADAEGAAAGASVSERSAAIIENSWPASGCLRTSRFGSLGSSSTGTVAKVMCWVSTLLTSVARSFSRSTLFSPESTVRALVAASARFHSLVGLVRVSPLLILRIIELMNCCWSGMRVRSPPRPTACRVRTKASASSPCTTCRPLAIFRCESGSSMSLAAQTSTPPTAVERVFTASKLTITKWSIRMPVAFSTVFQVQPGSRPSWPRLVLNIARSSPGMVFPAVWHSGIGTIRSRGMLITVALLRSFDRWNTKVVSACPVLPSSPYELPRPSRLSVPSTRMFSASPAACGRSASLPSCTLTAVMLPLKCSYA